MSPRKAIRYSTYIASGGSRGSFLDQTEGLEKFFFETSPLNLGSGWLRPSYLKVWIRHCIALANYNVDWIVSIARVASRRRGETIPTTGTIACAIAWIKNEVSAQSELPINWIWIVSIVPTNLEDKFEVGCRITLAVLRMLRSQGLFADRMTIRFKIEVLVETLREVSLTVVVKDLPVEVLRFTYF